MTADRVPHRGSRDTIDTHHRHTGEESLELEQLAGLEETTLDPAHPRPLHSPVVAVTFKLWRQLLGLNPFKGSYFGLYGSLKGTKDRLIAGCGVVFAIAAGIPLPLIGVIFGEIISGFPPSHEELHTRISQLLGVAVAFFSVTTIYTISFGLTGDRIAVGLRERLLYSLLHLDQSYLDIRDIDINALLSDKIDTIQVGCSEKVGIFLQSMSYFIAAFTVGFILNAKLTGILLAAVIPAMAIIIASGSTAISKLSTKMSSNIEQANNLVESALRAVKVVQAFNMITQICGKHHEYLSQSAKDGFRKAVASALELAGTFFTAYAANGLAFYIGSHMAAAGEAGGNAGTIYAVVFLILDASFVVGQFAPFLEIFARAASAFGIIQEILEACPEKPESASAREDLPRLEISGTEISLNHVSFSYPARPTVPAIDGMTLSIKPGIFTAIVGTSGGGKSTLVSILLRIYEYQGQIKFGNHELRHIDPHFIRSRIAVLDQDCILFSGTIFENICHGLVNEKLSDAECEARCRQAVNDAAVDFLDDLPKGIHTRIDNCLQLSGGQRQRICLARALIKKPALLILDEPSSALDAQSEGKVLNAIRQAMAEGTTVLMIAHRLSTVLDADHIAVVSDGRVAEEGPPFELSRDNTIFKGLLDAQNTNVESAQYALASPTDSVSKSSESSAATKTKENALDSVQDRSGVNISSRKLIAEFVRFTRPEHLIIIGGLFASILSGSIIIGEAIVFGNLVQLINSSTQAVGFQREADFYCLMFFVLACIALLSYASSGTAFGIASNRLTSRVQAALLSHVLYLDIDWFSKPGNSAYELSSSFSKDSGDLACLSGVALGTIFTVIASVLGGIVLAHAVAWKIAIVLLIAVPIMIASGYLRLRMLAKSEIRHRTKYSDATAFAIEACRSRRTVTILGIEDLIFQQYRESLQRPHRDGLMFTVLCNTLLAFSLAITYFVYALAYWWGAKQVRSGLYSQKQFFTVLPALLFSAQSAGQLFSLSPEIARAKTAAASIFRILATESKTINNESIHPNKHSSTPLESDQEISSTEKTPEIEFKDVSFSYQGNAAQTALLGVSFSIESGKTVALVGPSGAGKSSTIGLIERFYEPTGGQILFQGLESSKVDVQRLRSRMALVPQEPELFPGTISHNISLGAGDRYSEVSQEMIERVASQCGLHEFISSLPDGYHTDCVSVGNSQLSGGQQQRLSLARALIRDPEVLLLDEPTSALDAHSEQQVQAALGDAAKGRTTVMIAHRLASIQHADRILVFDHGSIVEQGTHSELVQRGGLYASMAKTQAIV